MDTVGKPHDGVSAAVCSSSSTTMAAMIPSLASSSASPGSVSKGGTGNAETDRKHGDLQRPSAAENAEVIGRGRRAGVGGAFSSSSSGGERCRVGFDMIRLLMGPDGNDALGRSVGVGPGEDVEAVVLGGGRSKVCTIVSILTG